MKTKLVEILIVITIFTVLILILLPAIQNEYVPTTDKLENSTVAKTFQVQPSELEGIYGNYDIDALVFSYRTAADDEISFESQLDKQATAAGWTKMPDRDGAFCYQRITPKRGQGFCGAEQARVKFDESTKRVTVGWAQGDTMTDVKSFSQASEADWAESKVWPKLD